MALGIKGGLQRSNIARQSRVLSGQSGFIGPQVHDKPDTPTNGEYSGPHEVWQERGEDAGHDRPAMHRRFSADRRRTRPRTTRPPALFHQVSASQPPAMSPRFSRRTAVDRPAPRIPTL